MTAHQFHDALTLLPADLIAEADRRRSSPPRRIPWKRYAAMAACFAMAVGCVFLTGPLFSASNETAAVMEAAEAESLLLQKEAADENMAVTVVPEEAVSEDSLCSLPPAAENAAADNSTITGASGTTSLYPGITIVQHIQTVPAAAACYSSTPAPVLFRSREALDTYREKSLRLQQEALIAACEGYDEAWFETHDLLLVTVLDVPSSQEAEIRTIQEEDGQWQILYAVGPDAGETALVEHHILLMVDKGLIRETDTILLIPE